MDLLPLPLSKAVTPYGGHCRFTLALDSYSLNYSEIFLADVSRIYLTYVRVVLLSLIIPFLIRIDTLCHHTHPHRPTLMSIFICLNSDIIANLVLTAVPPTNVDISTTVSHMGRPRHGDANSQAL